MVEQIGLHGETPATFGAHEIGRRGSDPGSADVSERFTVELCSHASPSADGAGEDGDVIPGAGQLDAIALPIPRLAPGSPRPHSLLVPGPRATSVIARPHPGV